MLLEVRSHSGRVARWGKKHIVGYQGGERGALMPVYSNFSCLVPNLGFLILFCAGFCFMSVTKPGVLKSLTSHSKLSIHYSLRSAAPSVNVRSIFSFTSFGIEQTLICLFQY